MNNKRCMNSYNDLVLSDIEYNIPQNPIYSNFPHKHIHSHIVNQQLHNPSDIWHAKLHANSVPHKSMRKCALFDSFDLGEIASGIVGIGSALFGYDDDYEDVSAGVAANANAGINLGANAGINLGLEGSLAFGIAGGAAGQAGGNAAVGQAYAPQVSGSAASAAAAAAAASSSSSSSGGFSGSGGSSGFGGFGGNMNKQSEIYQKGGYNTNAQSGIQQSARRLNVRPSRREMQQQIPLNLNGQSDIFQYGNHNMNSQAMVLQNARRNMPDLATMDQFYLRRLNGPLCLRQI